MIFGVLEAIHHQQVCIEEHRDESAGRRWAKRVEAQAIRVDRLRVPEWSTIRKVYLKEWNQRVSQLHQQPWFECNQWVWSKG